jgi:hypothetical protein
MSNVRRCIVDADAVFGRTEVSLLTDTGETVPMPSREQKSA